MKILIIGGTNFIGPPVVHQLSAMGHEVTVFHRGKTTGDLPPGVNDIEGDRHNLAEFKSEFQRISPQVVLDMIPFTEQDARNLVNTFKGIAQRVVAISSGDVYRAYDILRRTEEGAVEPVPLTEDSPLRSRLYPFRDLPERPIGTPEDYDKILVEKVVMGEKDLPGTILRLPMVYGPRDPLHRLFPYLKRMDDNRPAIVLEESMARWRGCWGYVENVAFAIALAVTDERAAGRIYNVGEASGVCEAERIRHIGRIAGWKGEVVVVSKSQMRAAKSGSYGSQEFPFNTDQHWLTDTTRIRQELGYSEPIPQDEALRRAIAWDRAHPPEEISQWAAPGILDYAAEDAILAALKQPLS